MDEALEHGLSILKTSRDELLPYGMGPVFQIVAGVLAHCGEHERASRLLGYTHQRFWRQRMPYDGWAAVDSEWFLTPLRERFGDELLSRLMAEGAAWSEDRALSEAELAASQKLGKFTDAKPA